MINASWAHDIGITNMFRNSVGSTLDFSTAYRCLLFFLPFFNYTPSRAHSTCRRCSYRNAWYRSCLGSRSTITHSSGEPTICILRADVVKCLRVFQKYVRSSRIFFIFLLLLDLGCVYCSENLKFCLWPNSDETSV